MCMYVDGDDDGGDDDDDDDDVEVVERPAPPPPRRPAAAATTISPKGGAMDRDGATFVICILGNISKSNMPIWNRVIGELPGARLLVHPKDRSWETNGYVTDKWKSRVVRKGWTETEWGEMSLVRAELALYERATTKFPGLDVVFVSADTLWLRSEQYTLDMIRNMNEVGRKSAVGMFDGQAAEVGGGVVESWQGRPLNIKHSMQFKLLHSDHVKWLVNQWRNEPDSALNAMLNGTITVRSIVFSNADRTELSSIGAPDEWVIPSALAGQFGIGEFMSTPVVQLTNDDDDNHADSWTANDSETLAELLATYRDQPMVLAFRKVKFNVLNCDMPTAEPVRALMSVQWAQLDAAGFRTHCTSLKEYVGMWFPDGFQIEGLGPAGKQRPSTLALPCLALLDCCH